jgi:hypothetical protein
MRLLHLLIAVSLLFATASSAQITVGTADLPIANDTFRLSVTNPPSGADFTLTGANYTWDFSQLTPQSQRVDTFLPLSATGNFQFLFFLSSNLATRGGNFNVGTGGIGANGTDVYNFYKNSSTSYAQTGLGATFNGLPIPATFSPKDLIYSFPLNYGDQDTSHSVYTLDLSALGLYFRGNRTRYNQVDGWGTLITPYGSRSVLRVKSTVIEIDSIHVDTFGISFGTNLQPVTTIEYKWLANGEGVPFLQANAAQNGTINQILYRDYRRSLISVPELDASSGFEVYPNPVRDALTIANRGPITRLLQVSMIDFQGRTVLQQPLEIQPGQASRLELSALASGHYVLHLREGSDRWVKIVTVE